MRHITLLFVLLMLLCKGCSMKSPIFAILDHSEVEAFGNVDFLESGLPGCIDWLVVDEEIYYYVSSLDADVPYDRAIGAFNDGEHGYTFYSLKGEEYEGIGVLEYRSMLDTVRLVYASKKARAIPCAILYDIPHIDSFISEGDNITLNDITYSVFGSVEACSLQKGEKAGEYNNAVYYQLSGYEGWVCTINEVDETRLDIYYDIEVEEIPYYLVTLTKEY